MEIDTSEKNKLSIKFSRKDEIEELFYCVGFGQAQLMEQLYEALREMKDQ